ncbi:MAG: ABC transporter permease [Chitinophagales bacterium]|nr:ABC transporter permease [Chitinophagales bacterium]
MLAVTRASLRSILRSPSAVVFSIAFPLIFIIVFGFIGGGNFTVTVGVHPDCDTSNQIFKMLKSRPEVNLSYDSLDALTQSLSRGHIAAIINIEKTKHDSLTPMIIHLQTSSAAREGAGVITLFMNHAIDKANLDANPAVHPIAELKPQELEGRPYKSIDFILPGMLGFSLLSTGVFGTAFVFYNLRSTLVLKRFFATPIRRLYIVMGEALARVTFATFTSSFIIILGYLAFGFTLVHGITTFLTMLLLCFIGLFIFMGFGFIVSSVATNESVIPVFANLITLPQFLLAGTFFSTYSFPWWLQPFTKILQLTYFNYSMRKIAFEGLSLVDVWQDLAVLGIWGVVAYLVAAKVFKWE